MRYSFEDALLEELGQYRDCLYDTEDIAFYGEDCNTYESVKRSMVPTEGKKD